ncbi:nicotinate-nucleotide pyrophosphorylase [Leifsonia xyli subsp. xyli]|uniref:Nicotinate-nucleotide pyrophosphorylase [carboxylating] n=2 Tax=Leifsonia xyli subsp. xyli TaxID=59736 RepID=Q6ADW5_LEIXX|nr:carboxylating nicotinate-nucleotide diphosphorylase [Leifsonia xyli]AAT89431.1 nicotinate-nucleotide pyrophosphorylase (carboxylating) [Leifsonia xyli subsp. xyli str. CTCB07]ODA90570.1 nicotinate-nucleotide pyrophosphorylase [Leifsonia xyli subsp. xyli]
MLTRPIIDAAVSAALAEDAPWGDLTSELLIPTSAYASARLAAREPGTFAGGEVFAAAMRLTDPGIQVILAVADGDAFEAGDTLATVSGPAGSVLTAERVALNFAQRMSGIATLTASFVRAVAHTSARIVDTRKTTPGLRAFERHAVRCGGGGNHRFSLSDAVMAKDNHLAVLTAQSGLSVTAALKKVRRELSHTTHLEVEVDRLDQIEPVLAAGVDTIMLDNFTLEQLREGVAIVDGRAIVEASGTVSLSTVRAIAETGVDIISAGALTHSVRSLDLGLDVVVETP